MRPASAGTGQVTGFSGLASWGPPAPGAAPVGSRSPQADSSTPPETASAVAAERLRKARRLILAMAASCVCRYAGNYNKLNVQSMFCVTLRGVRFVGRIYPMSEADREIQTAARGLADELLPHEVEAELAGGELPGGLLKVATTEQLDRWVVPTIRGERRECYAITEEGAGSDVDAIRATATRDGDGYLLNGVKWHVTSFNHADHVFFQGKLAGGANAGAHAMFVLDLDTPGIRVVRTPAYSHTYPYHHPVVAFEGVRVPRGQLIGEEGDGMRFAYEWFRYERLMIAARALGAAERLIEEATAFARRRHAYGRPIFDYQAIQFMLADSLTELWAARLMTYQTAHGIDADVDVKVQHAQCSMAKLYASEMAGRVADRAVQIFGGRGYMRENVAE